MNVVVEKELQERLRSASKKMGLTEREIIHRAVAAYLGETERMTDLARLKRELSAWDLASDQDFHSFENSLKNGRE